MKKNNVYWTDQFGKKWNVDNMEPIHIKNAFKFLLRRIEEHRIKDDVLMDFILNGDMANEFNDGCDATEIDIY